MRRKITDRLLEWKRGHGAKALMISGARQVGKTYSITEFVRENYRNSVYINFEDQPEMKALFENGTSADVFYERLSYSFDFDIEDCAIVLDEIQLCSSAMSALKPLAIDGRCDVIASGPLLGTVTDTNVLSPMGYTETIVMEPMDFEEFLWAMGLTRSQTESIGRHIVERTPMDDFVMKRLTDLFRRYMVVGGMPSAVRTYAEEDNYALVSEVHREIYDRICEDAKKYAVRRADKLRIQECLDSIPRQLSNEKKVFNYSDILMKRGYGQREYGSSILWLMNAGIIDVCHNLEEPAEPLRTKSRADSFRIYMKDTGILTYMLGSNVASGVVNGDFYVNNGALMENMVAESLIRKGYDVYFFLKEKRRDSEGRVVREGMELDFVVNLNGSITAIEVKSGRDRRSKSINRLPESGYKVDRRIKLAESNIMTDPSGIEHYPLFAVSFMEECRAPDLEPVDYIDDLKEALDRDASNRVRMMVAIFLSRKSRRELLVSRLESPGRCSVGRLG